MALHDFGMTPEGVFYYVMELLDGLDLDTLVRRFGPVPPERAVHLLSQACESLADAHAAGLIHRDVKPANLVTCHYGLKYDFVKVLDFGLVKAPGAWARTTRLTSDGMIAGTPAFIAPEVALGGRVLDARVDLYGLGCVAYWLLTGRAGLHRGRRPWRSSSTTRRRRPCAPSERLGRALPRGPRAAGALLPGQGAGRPSAVRRVAPRPARRVPVPGEWTPKRAREWWERNVMASASTAATGAPGGLASDTRTTLEGPPSSGRPKVDR